MAIHGMCVSCREGPEDGPARGTDKVAASAAPSVPEERANAEDEFRPSSIVSSHSLRRRYRAHGWGQTGLSRFVQDTDYVGLYWRRKQVSVM